MSVRRRLIVNVGAAALQRTIRVCEQLLLVPFFLQAWGAEDYGRWLTMMVVPTVLAFSEAGLGTAAASRYVLAQTAGDYTNARLISLNGFASISVLGTLALVAGFAALQFLTLASLPITGVLQGDSIAPIIILAVGARIICFYHPLIDAHYIARAKNHICINFQSLLAGVNVAVTIVALRLGKGPFAIVFVQLVVTAALTFLYYISIKLHRDQESAPNSTVELKLELMIDLARSGVLYLMMPIGQALYFQGTTLAVSHVLGPSAVATFSTLRAAIRSVNQVFAIVVGGFLSEIQLAAGRGQLQLVRKLFTTSLSLTFFVALLGSALLIMLGPKAYVVWTRGLLPFTEIAFYILVIGLLFNTLWWPASFLFQAFNKPAPLAKLCLAASISSVGLTLVFSTYYGMNGAAVGFVAMDVMLFLTLIPIACKLIHQPLAQLPGDIGQSFGQMVRRLINKKR